MMGFVLCMHMVLSTSYKYLAGNTNLVLHIVIDGILGAVFAVIPSMMRLLLCIEHFPPPNICVMLHPTFSPASAIRHNYPHVHK